MERRKMLGVILAGVLGLGSSLAAAQDKAIQVREAGEALKVSVEPTKPEYKVDEPIRFRVKGNDSFYLYVYSVDAATGNAWLLLPNKKSKDNRFEGGVAHAVPGRNVEFVADKPGKEKVVVVASAKKLDIESAKFASEGDFSRASESDMEKSFESKGIRVRDREESASADGVVVKRMEIAVVAGEERRREARAEGDGGVVFVTTARSSYSVGERVEVIYGADKAGWVHLYLVEPDGAYSLLKRGKVRGGEMLKVRATAEEPLGEHVLVTLLTKGEEVDERILDRVGEGKDSAKGLRVTGRGDEPAISTRTITIKRR